VVQHGEGHGAVPGVIRGRRHGVTVPALLVKVCVRVNRCRDKGGFGDSVGVRSRRPKRNAHLDGMNPRLWKRLSGMVTLRMIRLAPTMPRCAGACSSAAS